MVSPRVSGTTATCRRPVTCWSPRGRVDDRAFREASRHRMCLPSPYKAYAVTTGDAAYDPAKEDLLVLYRRCS